jgi:hypothetical protein
MGFSYVASGPLVRSSYHAAEAFIAAKINGGELPAPTANAYLDTRKASEADASHLHSAQTGSQLVPPSQLVRRRAESDVK